MLAAYVVVMAFTLVYTAEHYVIDILLGWALAGLVMGAMHWIKLRRAGPSVDKTEVRLSAAAHT